jgi:hypothetical protein
VAKDIFMGRGVTACGKMPSGVETPEENADFMSCLKARPTKHETFFRMLFGC